MSVAEPMTHCPEGAYTLGHLWMAGLGGMGVTLAVVSVLREIEARRPPPPDT